MFTNSVPNAYWGEAILIAAYLINRLPSKVLAFRTPLSVFLDFYPHHTRILNSLFPKVFRCTIFVHKYQPSQSKLEPKALKCIFAYLLAILLLSKDINATVLLHDALLCLVMYPFLSIKHFSPLFLCINHFSPLFLCRRAHLVQRNIGTPPYVYL